MHKKRRNWKRNAKWKCLIINLIYTINKVVIKETKKIFCKKLFAEERIQSKTFVQTNTYEEKEMSYRISEEYDDN